MKKTVLTLAAALMIQTAAYAASPDNKKIAWGLGSATDEAGRPADAVTAQSKYESFQSLFVGEADKRRLWLTFDEGYENGCTNRILDTLKEKNVSATFFVTLDYAERNPELIRRMLTEGHTVGNHTCSHPSLADCSPDEIRAELMGLHNYIKEHFDYDMYVMRPPKGEFSEQVLSIAKELGYTTVLWSFAYQDWKTDGQPDPDFAFERITSRTHNGAVILLHAVSETNTAILGDVIDFWRRDGFAVTPM